MVVESQARRLACPKCNAAVIVPAGQKPSCNACGFGQASAAPNHFAPPGAVAGQGQSSGLGTAAMVMGILALVFGLCGAIIFPVMGFFNLFALLAVIFGGVQLKRTRTDPARFGGRGPAKAGLVMGLIIYGIAIIGTVFWMVVLSGTSA